MIAKLNRLKKREIELNRREKEIGSKEKLLQEKENYYNKLIAEQQQLLEKIAGMKEEEAKQELFKKS